MNSEVTRTGRIYNAGDAALIVLLHHQPLQKQSAQTDTQNAE